MMSRTLRLTAALAAVALLAACGQVDDPEDTPSPVEDPAEDPTDLPADDPADEPAADDPAEDPTDPPADELEPDPELEPIELVLVTHDSFNVSEEVWDAFTEQTGIVVTLAPLGDAGTMVNQAILTRDNPQGDVLFGVDNTLLSRALDNDLFEPYRSPELDHVDERFVLDELHRVTPIDFGDVCLNYDRAWFDEADLPVPSDLDDLTDEAYRGLLAVQNPATSSPGLAFLLATVERFGPEGYLDFWEQLRANDVVVTDGWSEAYYDEFTATGPGERPLVVSYASSPPAEVFFAEPTPDEAPTGVIEASCFRQIEFAGILTGSAYVEAAEQLIDFLLSPEFQADVPLNMFVFPVREGVELPEVFVEHAVVPDQPLELDPEVIGERREEWIEAWTSAVLR